MELACQMFQAKTLLLFKNDIIMFLLFCSCEVKTLFKQHGRPNDTCVQKVRCLRERCILVRHNTLLHFIPVRKKHPSFILSEVFLLLSALFKCCDTVKKKNQAAKLILSLCYKPTIACFKHVGPVFVCD